MAAIKSFTSVPQSLKLKEFLPLESADMYYPCEGVSPKFGVALSISNNVPCWSLAALLELIPKEQHPELMINAHYKWICDISNPSSFTYKPAVGDNPVDACVEMIIKLHELNLL